MLVWTTQREKLMLKKGLKPLKRRKTVPVPWNFGFFYGASLYFFVIRTWKNNWAKSSTFSCQNLCTFSPKLETWNVGNTFSAVSIEIFSLIWVAGTYKVLNKECWHSESKYLEFPISSSHPIPTFSAICLLHKLNYTQGNSKLLKRIGICTIVKVHNIATYMQI